jgi:hypothetical protein
MEYYATIKMNKLTINKFNESPEYKIKSQVTLVKRKK